MKAKEFTFRVITFAIGTYIWHTWGLKGGIIALSIAGAIWLIAVICDYFDSKHEDEVVEVKNNVTVYLKPGDSVTINGQHYYNNTHEMMIIYA